MTGYTVNTGSTTKFAAGWDRVFAGGAAGATKKTGARASAKSTASKKSSSKNKQRKST